MAVSFERERQAMLKKYKLNADAINKSSGILIIDGVGKTSENIKI